MNSSPAQNIGVPLASNKRQQKFSSIGRLRNSITAAGAAHASYPRGIAVDSSGNVYFTDETNYRIVEMDTGLTTVKAILGTRGSGTGQFISPQTIAIDSVNNIYVVDSANYWVVKMTSIAGPAGPGMASRPDRDIAPFTPTGSRYPHPPRTVSMYRTTQIIKSPSSSEAGHV